MNERKKEWLVAYRGYLLQFPAKVGQLLVFVVVKLMENVSKATRAQTRMFVEIF